MTSLSNLNVGEYLKDVIVAVSLADSMHQASIEETNGSSITCHGTRQ